MSSIMKIPILEEYTKRNNIEYDFFVTYEYDLNNDSIFEINGDFFIKKGSASISMVDSNNNTLQFEEINYDILYEKDFIPIGKRLIREQKLKELGI